MLPLVAAPAREGDAARAARRLDARAARRRAERRLALLDGADDPALARRAPAMLRRGAARSARWSASLAAWRTPRAAPARRRRRRRSSRSRCGAEQTQHARSSFGDRLILKLFRRVEEGENPELEIGRLLTERTGFAHVAPTARRARVPPRRAASRSTLAVLHGFVAERGRRLGVHARRARRASSSDALALAAEPTPPLPDAARSSTLAADELPPDARARLDRRLPRARPGCSASAPPSCTLALARRADDPAFAPEPFTPLLPALARTSRCAPSPGRRSAAARGERGDGVGRERRALLARERRGRSTRFRALARRRRSAASASACTATTTSARCCGPAATSSSSTSRASRRGRSASGGSSARRCATSPGCCARSTTPPTPAAASARERRATPPERAAPLAGVGAALARLGLGRLPARLPRRSVGAGRLPARRRRRARRAARRLHCSRRRSTSCATSSTTGPTGSAIPLAGHPRAARGERDGATASAAAALARAGRGRTACRRSYTDDAGGRRADGVAATALRRRRCGALGAPIDAPTARPRRAPRRCARRDAARRRGWPSRVRRRLGAAGARRRRDPAAAVERGGRRWTRRGAARELRGRDASTARRDASCALALPARAAASATTALRVEPAAAPRTALVLAAPRACPRRRRRPRVGRLPPLYALHSRAHAGASATSRDAARGSPTGPPASAATLVGTLPLLASFLGRALRAEPVRRRSSRLFWNELYVDLRRARARRSRRRRASPRAAAPRRRARRTAASSTTARRWPPKRRGARGAAAPRCAGRRPRRARGATCASTPSSPTTPRFRAALTSASGRGWPRLARAPASPRDDDDRDAATTSTPSGSCDEQLATRRAASAAPASTSTCRSACTPTATTPGATASSSRAARPVGAPPDDVLHAAARTGASRRCTPSGCARDGHALPDRLPRARMLRPRARAAHRPRDGPAPALLGPARRCRRRDGVYVRYPPRSCTRSLCLESHRHGAIGRRRGPRHRARTACARRCARTACCGMYVAAVRARPRRATPLGAARLPRASRRLEHPRHADLRRRSGDDATPPLDARAVATCLRRAAAASPDARPTRSPTARGAARRVPRASWRARRRPRRCS